MKTLRFLLVITVAIALTFLLTPTVKAAEEAAAPAAAEKAEPAKAEKAEPAKKAKEKIPTVKGEIASIDTAANSVVIKDAKGKETTVALDKDTVIEKGKAKLAIGDLKVGEKVTAKGAEADGKMIAKSIRVHVPKAAKATPKAEEKKAEPEKAAEPAAAPEAK